MASALSHFTENLDLPQNLSTARIEPTNFEVKDNKITFVHNEINVKTEQQQSILNKNDMNSDNFDKFIKRAKKYDPLLLWGVLRPKVLNHVTVWDVLVDKTVIQAQAMPVGNVPSERIRIMLNEISNLIHLGKII